MTVLDGSGHILRHVTPINYATNQQTKQPKILGAAFIATPRHKGKVSYNWREFFSGDIDYQLFEIKRQFRRTRKKSHFFAELNIGQSLAAVNEHNSDLNCRVILDSLRADSTHPLPDESHSVMENIPDNEDVRAEVIGDILSKQVKNIYLAGD